ncbi:MAG TPA: DedA family protein [Solirubrobacteraceae bacterium]|nr:DedA family protein [Solirubrobacteraceae bacterium]
MYELASVTSSLVTLVTHVIDDLGLPGLFLLLLAGSSGIPISSEAVMLFTGYDVYHGHWSLATVIVVGIAGDLSGATIAYGIGYFGRIELVRRHGKKIHLTPERFERVERWFARRGAIVVLISRLLPLVRAYTSFPAGAARMRYSKFLLLSLGGGLPWIAFWGILGYELAPSYHSVQNHLRYVDYVGLALILVVVAWLVLKLRRRRDAAASEPA